MQVADVLNQRAGGARRQRKIVAAERRQVMRAENLAQRARGPGRLVIPIRNRRRGIGVDQTRIGLVLRDHDFGRAQPRQFIRQSRALAQLESGEPTAGNLQRGDADAPAGLDERGGQVFAPAVQQVLLGQRARRDDARDLALDRAFGGGRVADLLANRHRHRLAHQLGEILVDAVARHAGHRNRLAGRFVARGQGDVEQGRGALGVFVKQLVKIAHAVEQEGVGVVGFERQILANHRRVLGGRDTRQGGGGGGFHARGVRRWRRCWRGICGRFWWGILRRCWHRFWWTRLRWPRPRRCRWRWARLQRSQPSPTR